jgi:hypothetical protein
LGDLGRGGLQKPDLNVAAMQTLRQLNAVGVASHITISK